jgi:hypothetical protein
MSGWRLRLVALASQLVIASVAQANDVEYIYIEPNAGSSAGGHVAVRFGERVYDFQNADFGALRLRRSRYETFRYLYSVLENRTMRVARIDVSDVARSALLDRFNQRHLIENKYFSVLRALRDDRELIQLLLSHRPDSGSASVKGPRANRSLRGAGLFYGAKGDTHFGTSEALLALRDRVAARFGRTSLLLQLDELEREVTRLAPRIEVLSLASESSDGSSISEYHFSDRYRDLSLKILALRTLIAASTLRPDASRVVSGDESVLSARDRQRLRQFADWLEAGLVDLVASRRPDWGYSLLLGMARLQTLHESLRTGRLVVLDGLPADSEVLPESAVRRRDPFVIELHDRARTEFVAARSHFAAAERIRESDYAWLEETANRYREFQRGFEEDRAIRFHATGLLPAPIAMVSDLPLPHPDVQTLEQAESSAVESERLYRYALKERFGYHLITRNCVTEIFEMMDAELDPPGSVGRLDGSTASAGALDFIPVVSYGSVLDTYSIAEKGEIPSYRRLRLEAMYADENDLGVYLRESNTLTSTIYRRNERDSFFLFFTDDVVLLRPVYGAFNLVAGIGEMSLGLLRAPWDRGNTLWSGLKGAIFSLPELAFVNLRKGVLEYAPGDTPRTAMRSEGFASNR